MWCDATREGGRLSDERSCPRSRDIDRLERRQDDHERDVRENYVTEKFFNARVGPLEQRSNNVWLSNRMALLAFAGTIIGIIVSAYMATRGGGR
jgi:hypothetical protein